MNRTEHLLVLLAEECAEVAQRASKALRFGLDEIQPRQPLTNRQRIMDELEDIRVIVELLRESAELPLRPIDQDVFDRKKEKVKRFMAYSVDCGAL